MRAVEMRTSPQNYGLSTGYKHGVQASLGH